MNEEQLLVDATEKAINSAQDAAQIAASLAKVDIPKSNNLSVNAQILADFISEFQFDWDNDTFDDDILVSDKLPKIRQILSDIKSGNQYKKVFSAELAYSYFDGSDFSYKLVTEKMQAKTADEAVIEKDEIHAKAPKQHAEDKNYVLEDVRVMVKVVDQNDKVVLLEQFLLN